MEDVSEQERRDRLDWNERERNAVNYCALRFDGYQYLEDQKAVVNENLEHDGSEFVISSIPSLDEFLDEPNFDLPKNTLHAMFFIFQRAWMRERWLQPNSYGAKIYRELFLLLCRESIDRAYRNRAFGDTWKTDYLPHLDDYVRMVENSLSTTEFTSKRLWQKDRQ